MTTAAVARNIEYAENGSSTAFPVPFAFINNSDVKALRRTASGEEILLTYNVDYTVAGQGNPMGGTLTVSAAAAAGVTLAIWSETARGQTTDYATGDRFPAESHERALDRLDLIAQEQDRELERVPQFPRGATPRHFVNSGDIGQSPYINEDGNLDWIPNALDLAAAAQAAASTVTASAAQVAANAAIASAAAVTTTAQSEEANQSAVAAAGSAGSAAASALAANEDAAAAGASAVSAGAFATLASNSASNAASAATMAAAAAATAVNGPTTSSASASSVTIGTGSKTFVVEVAKTYFTGQFVVAAKSDDASKSMFGQVSSFDPNTSTLVVDVSWTRGSGTVADWIITASGAPGEDGLGSGTVTSVSGTGTRNGLTLTGNVTGAGSLELGGTLVVGTPDLEDDAVTYAKMQNVSATNRVLGRSSAGAGNVEEITCTSFARQLMACTTKEQVAALLGIEGVKPGTIAKFAMPTPPAGYLKCNGAAVSRATYAALFAEIGITYGPGNGSTTFNLPEARGEFDRGWDDGRGVDSGRVLGSFQNHQMQQHAHTYQRNQNGGSGSPGGSGGSLTTATTGAAGGTANSSETRPRNIAWLVCIKT